MHPSARPELCNLAPVHHGGNAPPGALDFSTGVCPLPPPVSVLRAMRHADVTRYPHPTALPLRMAIARTHQIPTEDVAVGNGSTELIWALARAFGGEGRTVLVLGPTFGEYAQATRVSGAKVAELRCLVSAWKPGRIYEAARRAAPSLVFLCRPNNPSLNTMDAEVVAGLAELLSQALIVVDEAYLPLFDGIEPQSPGRNIAVLRSLTKTFALPGLRLGYLLAATPVATAVQAVLPPWNVSTPASLAAEAALTESDALAAARTEVARLRVALREGLTSAGASVEAAGGPFVLCRVDNAAAFTKALAGRGIWVRDCTSFGMPNHVRIGVRSVWEQEALLRAWHEVMEVAA